MSEVLIREATVQDALFALEKSIFADVQQADKALVGYMTMSDRTYVGLVDGEIVCVWGVMRQSLMSDRGYLWMITAAAAEEHKFLIIRYSQRIIENLLKRYRVLIGECAVGNSQARKWMRLLGAEFSPPEGQTIPFQITGVKWQTRSH